MAAQRTPLDGGRWHFQHGPIDIVVQAEGDASVLAQAHEAAWQRFAGILDELVGELRGLRQPVSAAHTLKGQIAQRMRNACEQASLACGSPFITPMAAVAGSVAQELIAFYRRPGIERAWVNNGGDIALHLAPGRSARVGVFADLARFDPMQHEAPLETDGQFDVHASTPVRGIATSGWRGRSFSLGIADSVTVLAQTAAQADAAATLIANAVNVEDAAIQRRPASECKDDSDLGDLPVTVDVAVLAPTQVQHALAAGALRAGVLQRAGLIWSVALVCQGQWRIVQPLSSLPAADRAALPPRPMQGHATGSVFA
ncbi:UPF0280 family protein [Variovorax sp. OV329]|uniref:UPF0280 family protein n=1 Tax=Variovorax sp. OV329 TaxID=1882825 RepID=UPI0008E78192|nr:UPF0280 family protein [Variovorax sp. OV329]SFM27625.1 hypothetical protein SAMN05444747_10421 [Variovorax sp. OV329]